MDGFFPVFPRLIPICERSLSFSLAVCDFSFQNHRAGMDENLCIFGCYIFIVLQSVLSENMRSPKCIFTHTSDSISIAGGHGSGDALLYIFMAYKNSGLVAALYAKRKERTPPCTNAVGERFVDLSHSCFLFGFFKLYPDKCKWVGLSFFLLKTEPGT